MYLIYPIKNFLNKVYLAKEAGLLYAVVAVATDYDCWKDCKDNVHAADVMEVFKQNINKIRNIFIKTVKLIGERNWDKEIDTLQVIFIIFKNERNIN